MCLQWSCKCRGALLYIIHTSVNLYSLFGRLCPGCVCVCMVRQCLVCSKRTGLQRVSLLVLVFSLLVACTVDRVTLLFCCGGAYLSYCIIFRAHHGNCQYSLTKPRIHTLLLLDSTTCCAIPIQCVCTNPKSFTLHAYV